MPDVPQVDWKQHPELKDYDSSKLDAVLASIWSYLVEQGRVTQYELREEGKLSGLPIAETTIYTDILKDMREFLAEKNLIDVETEDTEKFGNKKKFWVIDR